MTTRVVGRAFGVTEYALNGFHCLPQAEVLPKDNDFSSRCDGILGNVVTVSVQTNTQDYYGNM